MNKKRDRNQNMDNKPAKVGIADSGAEFRIKIHIRSQFSPNFLGGFLSVFGDFMLHLLL